MDLLPVGHGRSGIRGDTRDMARARRRFLGRGHYDPLADRVRDRVLDHVNAEVAAPAVAEAGCGEGFYIGAVAAALPEGSDLLGFDVSRDALRLAAPAHPRVTFAINDVKHRLCLADDSLDALLDVFAPRNAGEFARVLRPEGLLVVVIPGDDHLAQLRRRLPLLDIQPEKRERTLERLAPSFEPAWEEVLEYDAELPGEDVADLVRMTPSAHHLGDDAPATLERVSPLTVTLSFRVLGLTPRASTAASARSRPRGRSAPPSS